MVYSGARSIMRLAFALLLLAASPSTVSVGCVPRSQRPDPDAVAVVELHAWSASRHGENYWVTRLELASGCVSTELLDDGIVHNVRDCSISALVRPRLAELVAVFELDADAREVGERIGEGDDGHGVVLERGDGSRWTSDSKLLEQGGTLLDRDIAEWMMLGPDPASLSPTPAGWMQLQLGDGKGVQQRQLDADGRWSCVSWLMSDQSLEHHIVTRRGRISSERAAKLLDAFADGVPDGKGADEWHATMVHTEPRATIELHGELLVERWNVFARELDDGCVLQ